MHKNNCILKYVRKGPIENNPALVQTMAWRRSGDMPLSEPMMISLPTRTCVTRPQWVNYVVMCFSRVPVLLCKWWLIKIYIPITTQPNITPLWTCYIISPGRCLIWYFNYQSPRCAWNSFSCNHSTSPRKLWIDPGQHCPRQLLGELILLLICASTGLFI